jgi:prevent-host-death family protein
MKEIGVRELKERTSDVIRSVRENHETYSITYRGRVVARLMPVGNGKVDEAQEDALWEEMDELAKEISRKWPKGVSAAEAVAEQRR